jgi:predicted O-methyltransferase YrrM
MWANLRGASIFPPGHFYSPLIDIEAQASDAQSIEFDGLELWEHIDLRPEEMRRYYTDLVAHHSTIHFPKHRDGAFRYFSENQIFTFGDAFVLSAILQKEKPRRVVEVGSGFSSAVMLDTAGRMPDRPSFTFIEPYPKRLESVITSGDIATTTILRKRVQEVPLAKFDELEAGDFLFIDSSHVGKVGSDVAFLFLRILPRLKPGVIVHFHDIFYPWSYPIKWMLEGRAWNESLFVRTLLAGGDRFQVMAFNSFAAHAFPEFFRENVPEFLKDPGGSLWLKKVK